MSLSVGIVVTHPTEIFDHPAQLLSEQLCLDLVRSFQFQITLGRDHNNTSIYIFDPPTGLHVKLATSFHNICDGLHLYGLLVLFLRRFPAEELVVVRKVDELGVGFTSVD